MATQPPYLGLLSRLSAGVDPDLDTPSLLMALRRRSQATIQPPSTSHARFAQTIFEAITVNAHPPVHFAQTVAEVVLTNAHPPVHFAQTFAEVIYLVPKPSARPRMWAIRMTWEDYVPQDEPVHPKWLNRRFSIAPAPAPPPPSSAAPIVVVMS